MKCQSLREIESEMVKVIRNCRQPYVQRVIYFDRKPGEIIGGGKHDCHDDTN